MTLATRSSVGQEANTVETVLVIDAHQHVGFVPGVHDELRDIRHRGGIIDEPESIELDIARRADAMRSSGVSQAIVIPGHAYLRPDGIKDTRAANDGIAAYRDARPDLFPAAIGVAEPLYGDVGLKELDRMCELGLRGVSFHARYQAVNYGSPWLYRYVEKVATLGLVPYLHVVAEVVDSALWRLTRLALDFPDLEIVAVDAFSSFERGYECMHVAALAPNIVFDTSLSRSFTQAEALIKEFGVNRVLFGTDQYSVPRREHSDGSRVRQILDSGLSESDKAAVLGGNIQRILGLDAASRP
jgi:predicted TIM-barrel fold metal-dependent hydrolase